MKQKERIDEMQKRIERIEGKLWPKTGTSTSTLHRRIISPSPDATFTKAPLQELTEEEAAWLKAREMPTDSRQQLAFSMRNADTSDTERRILAQLKKKRNVFVTWQA